MAKRGVRKQEHERLDDTTLSRVISLLESDSPITKKAACETLNISYNTTRLNKIIEDYKSRMEYRKKRYDANKGKPISDLDIKELVTGYLNGESIASIARQLYRSEYVIRAKIKQLNLPERTKDSDYFNPDLIPDEAVSKYFEPRELVWSSRYNAVAEIRDKIYCLAPDSGADIVYRIWVFGKHNEFAAQPWWELGKLDIVKKFELTADKFMKTEKPNFAYRIQD